MKRFSERYGYVTPSDVLIREKLTLELENAICSCYDRLKSELILKEFTYLKLEEYLWTYFFKKRKNDYWTEDWRYKLVTTFIKSDDIWHRKIDLIEETINYLNLYLPDLSTLFKNWLNYDFSHLNFAYRIVGNYVREITTNEEICAIESALENNFDSVKRHFHEALKLFSVKPEGDYRNSIKESISAVEAFTRELTGEKTLNLKKMEEKGIILPASLRKAFEVLYGYTNDESTGIRHALMDDTNRPGSEEALFMLVSCSAFINYLTKKMKDRGDTSNG